MRTKLLKLAGAVAIAAGLAATAWGQVPPRTQIHFTINVPYAVRMGTNYTLAPGRYVLYQDGHEPEMFALYPVNLKHEPIAIILTNQTPYWAVPDNRTTFVGIKIDEDSPDAHPVLTGFNAPFADSWNIVSVVVKKESRFITRIH